MPESSIFPIPVKTFDIFSIIVPGASVLVSCYLFEHLYLSGSPRNGPEDFPVHWALSTIWDKPSGPVAQAVMFLIVLFVAYLFGHIVAGVSNFVIERLIVYKCHGWPYEFLMLGHQRRFTQLASRHWHRGCVFWSHVTLLIAGVSVVRWSVGIAEKVIAVMFCGWLLVSIMRSNMSRKAEAANGAARRIWRRRIIKIIVVGFARPYNMCADIYERTNRTNAPLERAVITKYMQAFTRHFNMDSRNAASNNFWFTLFYLRRRAPRLLEFIQRWQQTSLFSRNIAMSFYCTYIYALLLLMLRDHPISSVNQVRLGVALLVTLLLAFMMTLRYYYFYVAYWSKCLFRAFVFLDVLDESSPRSAEAQSENPYRIESGGIEG